MTATPPVIKLPDPPKVYNQDYMNQLLKALRLNQTLGQSSVADLQSKIDKINAILAKHHIT